DLHPASVPVQLPALSQSVHHLDAPAADLGGACRLLPDLAAGARSAARSFLVGPPGGVQARLRMAVAAAAAADDPPQGMAVAARAGRASNRRCALRNRIAVGGDLPGRMARQSVHAELAALGAVRTLNS